MPHVLYASGTLCKMTPDSSVNVGKQTYDCPEAMSDDCGDVGPGMARGALVEGASAASCSGIDMVAQGREQGAIVAIVQRAEQ